MDGIYRQNNFMLLNDLANSGYPIQNDHAAMEDYGSDSEFDSDDSEISNYTDIDVNILVGRGVAIWTYNKLDSLTLFTPRRGDTLFHVTKYAEINLDFDYKKEKIMVIDPGDKHPKDVQGNFSLRPGSVVMVMPKYNVNVTVEVNQLKTKFPMCADLMCTVYDVKGYIKRLKGIPIDQQDILYRDKVLENSKRLFEYKIRNGGTMYVLIQVHFDLLVNVETFWGKTYRLYIDRCSTGSDLIYTVFSRTFSQYSQKLPSVHELFVPIHVLLLQHQQRSIHWNYCIGYFGIKNGDTLVLTTVGRQSNIEMRNLVVVTEIGDNHEISVSKFDRWSVVAFIMHGLTDVPVDLIRLYHNEKLMDFTAVIGNVPPKTAVIMNIMMSRLDKDISFGLPLKIGIGNGIVENIKMAPTRTVKDVKQRLEDMGVPNATLYELTHGKYRLPKHARLQDVITDLNTPLVLRVEKFPVFVHAPDGIIYKTMVDVNHTLRHFKHKFELKTGHANSTCRMLVAGQELKLPESAILYENGFSTRTSVFVESSSFNEMFYIFNGDLLVKLKLPIRPMSGEIKKIIWAADSLPEGAITCLQTFFFWYFYPRASRKYMLPKKKKNRKRLPVADQPLPQISNRKSRISHDDLPDIHTDMTEVSYLPKGLRARSPTNALSKLKKPVTDFREKSGSWKSVSNYDPGFNRSKPTREKRQNRPPDIIKSKTDPQPSRSPDHHHVMPRWMGNLHQKDDAHRLMAMNKDGMAYRQLPDQKANPFIALQRSDPSWTRRRGHCHAHHQGDATRYYKKKPAYDRQVLLFSSSSDSDSDDGRDP